MFDPTFDPMAELMQIKHNQAVMFNNDQQLAQAIEDLRAVVKNQQEIIDLLQRGLDAANKANELFLTQGLDRLYRNYSATGEH
jgi:DNA-binding ferritin-like protein